jgi:hypothetical protein
VNFFFDANVPPKLGEAVRVLTEKPTFKITLHRDVFDADIPDTAWIKAISGWSPKPFVIGGDGAILRRPGEALALKEADLTYFVLADGFPSLKLHAQAIKFLQAWESILDKAGSVKRPTIFKVTVNAKVERVALTADLKTK